MARWKCEACGHFLGETGGADRPPYFPGGSRWQEGDKLYLKCQGCGVDIALKSEPPGGNLLYPLGGVEIS